MLPSTLDTSTKSRTRKWVQPKTTQIGEGGKTSKCCYLWLLQAELSCKWVYKMLGLEFKQACLYFYWNWVQKLIVKTLDTSWVKQLHDPDGIVLSLCKTCAKVKAVLVPEPPCLIFRTASQILMPTNKGPTARKIMPKCVVLNAWSLAKPVLAPALYAEFGNNNIDIVLQPH